MSLTKNQYLRYRILNMCFTDKHKQYWTIDELIKTLEEKDLPVVRRTVERDLEAMRNDERLAYHAPIVYDRSAKAFHYRDAQYTIDTIPLTTHDLDALALGNNILQQYKGVKMMEQFEGVVNKVNKMVRHKQRPPLKRVIIFDEEPYYKGRDYFDQVTQAVMAQQPLRIIYRKFTGECDQVHILHPYFMKEYHGRWYVLGYSEARQDIITLALDRMMSVSDATVTFRENTALQPELHFKHTLGITARKRDAEEIELWFSPARAPYIKTRHLHHTQKTVSDDADGLVITLQLTPNHALLRLLLRYCDDVVIRKPDSLRAKVMARLEKGLERNRGY